METWYVRAHRATAVITVRTQPHVSGDELRFLRLRKEWIRGTEKLSVLTQIVLHPAYQQIIAMGPVAIPMILQSLERKLDHWFWALKILNQNEDVAEGRDTLQGAAEAWLKWGREQGHLD